MSVNLSPNPAPAESPDQPRRPWLDVHQAAQRAGVGPRSIYKAAHKGELRGARITGRRTWRFLETWIDSWVLGKTA